MSKNILFIIALLVGISSFAQSGGEYEDHPPATYKNTTTDNDQLHGFKKENIFLGGSIQIGYSGNTFSLGGNPEIGYSIAQWLDAGVAFNLNYASERADPTGFYNADVRTRSFNYGSGVFIRAYPVRFLFFELQPEINWIHQSETDYINDLSYSGTYQSTSLIGGIGYTQRILGQGSFYTLIGVDLLNNIYSPYRDYNGSAIPIIRAGFDIYLHPSKK